VATRSLRPGALTASGDSDKAVAFNGSSAKAVMASAVKFGSSNFTIEAWFKTSTTGTGQTIFRTGANPEAPNASAVAKLTINSTNNLRFLTTDANGSSANLTSSPPRSPTAPGITRWERATALYSPLPRR